MRHKWFFKAVLQKMLSALPGGTAINQAISEYICRNLPPDISTGVELALQHWTAVERYPGVGLAAGRCVEVGPGWAPVNAIVFYVAGVREQWLYDLNYYCRPRYLSHLLAKLPEYLDQISRVCGVAREVAVHRYEAVGDSDMPGLREVGIRYCAPSDAANTDLPDSSVDMLLTSRVLEHIPSRELNKLLTEWRRILRPGGVMSHIIDCSDHYSHCDGSISPVNFLRFNERTWELVSSRLSYCNRLRESEHIRMFREAGFDVMVVSSHISDEALEAVKSMPLAERFADMDPRDLAVVRSHIVAERPALVSNLSENRLRTAK